MMAVRAGLWPEGSRRRQKHGRIQAQPERPGNRPISGVGTTAWLAPVAQTLNRKKAGGYGFEWNI
jgi:hypothetical protein